MPTTSAAGDGVGFRLRIANAGPAPARRTTTVLLLSRDARRSRDDVRAATARTRALPARSKVAVHAALAIPAGIPPGAYRVLACADGRRRVRERREGNNGI